MVVSAISPPPVSAPVGEAPAFRDMLAHVSQVAPIDRPVLIVGERGTGKELIASRLNYLSARWDRPFIKLNCAALSETLLDSELFGHEAGAFTGAVRRRASRFELADGGTLFLDEIANASLAVQEKVLRVIEYGTFERVGGNEVHHVDVRVIAATNADLPALAEAGKFRTDLLDRLAFDVINLPPLRERREDIPLLAEHFATRMASELRWEFFPGFTEAAMTRLMDHDWPGNVRELRNTIERSVYRMTRPAQPLDRIVFDPFESPHRPRRAPDIVIKPAAPDNRPTVDAPSGEFLSAVRAYESALLRQALESSRFNQKEAARKLGLTYYQMRNYLKKHGLMAGN
jgi:psp operon transcriptional activator